MRAKIRYNNRIIAFTDSPNITIPCKNLNVATDIEISADDCDTCEITYGDVVSSIVPGQKAILTCKDTSMQHDVVVSLVAEMEPTYTLTAPTITLDGDILAITDVSGVATSFDILADGVVVATVDNAVK